MTQRKGLQTIGKSVLMLTALALLLGEVALKLLNSSIVGYYAVFAAVTLLSYDIAAWRLGIRDDRGDNYRTISNIVTCVYPLAVAVWMLTSYLFNFTPIESPQLLLVGVLCLMLVSLEFHETVRVAFMAKQYRPKGDAAKTKKTEPKPEVDEESEKEEVKTEPNSSD
jgi:hypothetical protein